MLRIRHAEAPLEFGKENVIEDLIDEIVLSKTTSFVGRRLYDNIII